MFRAYDPERERLVAIKLFTLDLPPERVHQLVAALEGVIAAPMAHPSIAAPLAAGISGVSAFLVQEYVAAESLDLAVREYGPAPISDAVRVATQLGTALDLAAEASIVHGALHPRDVLLSTDDTRMTGLGVARALAQAGATAPVRRPYTAPERIDGGDWDRRADVFSLAALIFELVSGRRIAGTGEDAVDGLGDVTGANADALRSAFARALAEDPDARFSTALQFAEALRDACSGESKTPAVAAVAPPAPEKKKRAPRKAERPTVVAAPVEVEPPLFEVDAIEPREPVAPAESVEPVVTDFELQRAEETRYAEVEAAPAFAPPSEPELRAGKPAFAPPSEPELRAGKPAFAPPNEPEIRSVPEPPPYVPPVTVPSGLITGDPEPLTSFERSRSAVWPIVLALGVGVAIGFAGGYFTGAQTRTATAAVAPTGREFTEAAVPPATSPPQSPVASPKSQVESQADSPKSQVEAAKPEAPKPELPRPATRDSRPTGDSRLATSDLRPETSRGPGRLLIRSAPVGAMVTVDGKEYGRTPATVRDLAIGPHHVTVARPGYAPSDRRIVLTRARPAQTMNFALVRGSQGSRGAQGSQGSRGSNGSSGSLTVDSRPPAAKVYLDGRLIGSTPLSVQTVAAGDHAIRLERDGYKRWSSQVRVVASEKNRVTASLER